MTSKINGSSGISLDVVGGNPRILGDFSNGTPANRVMFKTTTPDGATVVMAVPDGTGTSSFFGVLSKSDVANASNCFIEVAEGGAAAIRTGRYGTGTFLPLRLNVGGIDAMSVNPSGNIGVGSVEPPTKLFVKSNINTNLTVVPLVSVASDREDRYASINCYRGTNSEEIGISFSTSKVGVPATERMRLDPSGIITIGAFTDNPVINRINGFTFNPGGPGHINVRKSSFGWDIGMDGNSGQQINWYTDNGSTQIAAGFISSSGSTTAYNTSSDYRLKENITPLTGALDFVLAQRPVSFNWKANGTGAFGYIAHWMQEDGAGFCVYGEKDAVDEKGAIKPQAVDTSFLVPHLNAAIQELAALVSTLRTELDEAKAEIAALKGV